MQHTLEEWEDGWRVRLPLPFQLKWIHSYLLRGDDGYTVIDCGLHYDDAWQTWQDVFAHLDIRMRDIARIVLTHYHPDHYGMAGKLQQESGADVWMSAVTKQQAQLFWRTDNGYQERVTAFYRSHGLPSDTAAQMTENLHNFKNWVAPHPVSPRILAPGETCTLGDRPYEVWHTPGHAEGHLSFYDPEREWLIGGDVLLDKITPNVSLYPGSLCDQNPLGTFLSTLNHLKTKPIRKVLPAHGPVITNVHTRIQEIIAHHDERLDHIERLADGSRTAYDICIRLFGTELSIHNMRFAMAETLAHLEYLRRDGRLTLDEGEETRLYTRA